MVRSQTDEIVFLQKKGTMKKVLGTSLLPQVLLISQKKKKISSSISLKSLSKS